MILILFIHITDTERNITRKDGEISYNNYRVHRYIAITNCTTAALTTTLHDISQAA